MSEKFQTAELKLARVREQIVARMGAEWVRRQEPCPVEELVRRALNTPGIGKRNPCEA